MSNAPITVLSTFTRWTITLPVFRSANISAMNMQTMTGTRWPASVNSFVGTSAVRYRANRGNAGNTYLGATIGRKSKGASMATTT